MCCKAAAAMCSGNVGQIHGGMGFQGAEVGDHCGLWQKTCRYNPSGTLMGPKEGYMALLSPFNRVSVVYSGDPHFKLCTYIANAYIKGHKPWALASRYASSREKIR